MRCQLQVSSPHRVEQRLIDSILEISLAKVRLQFATEEAALAASAVHEVSGSAFLSAGFDLEDLQ